MCGIFGYLGKKDALETCIKGLELLEYRGYDSTGIAGIANGAIHVCKEVGKLSNLKAKLTLKHLEVAIGHTRWATHGKVTQPNAHPHLDAKKDIALVHNGIIENFDELKQTLVAQGVAFTSDTDSEVIAQLIGRHYRGDLLGAVQEASRQLKGHFAFLAIHKDHPDTMIAVARECPLSIGIDDAKTESIVSSDPNAFLRPSFNISFLGAGEVAEIAPGKIRIFDAFSNQIEKKRVRLEGASGAASKEGYAHFMLKEIHEQPRSILRAIESDLTAVPEKFFQASEFLLIGCGTSAHAGAIGALYFEELAKTPSRSEIASEARYRIFSKNTFVIAISQSGETADTVAAVREIRAKGFFVLGICNVKNSSLTREADATVFLDAGVEMSVCSTKAFTSQIALLYRLAALRSGQSASGLQSISAHMETILKGTAHIQNLAKKYAKYKNFFFMGRHYMFPTCMESALKLKEISYVNANGYPAGELKHGPIALLDSEFPVVAFCANRATEEKILSNLQEVKARGAPTLAIALQGLNEVEKIADDVLWLPKTSDSLAPFTSVVAGQLLAYYIALELGSEIDQPRNLAKSVTVE
jgi:glucosamine--fructose-6-phosphate aminotransferase (isomerizing)